MLLSIDPLESNYGLLTDVAKERLRTVRHLSLLRGSVLSQSIELLKLYFILCNKPQCLVPWLIRYDEELIPLEVSHRLFLALPLLRCKIDLHCWLWAHSRFLHTY